MYLVQKKTLKQTLQRTALLLGLTALSLGTTQASAGDLLRLKAGNIQLNAKSESIFVQEMNNLANDFDLSDAQREFVVQFKSPVTGADKKQIKNFGFQIRSYIPDDALLIMGNGRSIEALRNGMQNLNAVIPFVPSWKLSEDLGATSVFNSESREIVVVRTASKMAGEISTKVLGLQGRVHSLGERSLVLDLPRKQFLKLAAINGVEFVQPSVDMQTMDARLNDNSVLASSPNSNTDYSNTTGFESGTKIMNFDAAWNRGFTGKGQIAAMADTGVDTGVVSTLTPDLKGVTKGYIMGMWAKDWGDPNGHGTHVSGSVMGNGSHSNGLFKGGAYEAEFLPAGMWSPVMNNLTVNPDFNITMGSSYTDGARIHTNSWGSPKSLGAYDSFSASADDFMWKHPDMLILFAAGNSGVDKDRDGHIDPGSVSSPGTAKNVLTVGASENYLLTGGIQKQLGDLRGGAENWGVEPLRSDRLSDNPNGIAAFSSRGPCKDGRLKPEVVAPGTNIVSVRSTYAGAGLLWGAYNDFYAYSGGTSMATPLVAGAATVTRQYLVEKKGISNPSGALVKAVLMATSTDMFPGQYGTGAGQEIRTLRPNNDEGFGRVNVDLATNIDRELTVDETTGVGLNESKTYTVNLSQGNITAVLSYTDAPADTSAAKALVNDLDLELVSSSGQVVKAPQDRINNTEVIEMKGISAGRYTLRVKGVNVPNGKNGRQPFALVVLAK